MKLLLILPLLVACSKVETKETFCCQAMPYHKSIGDSGITLSDIYKAASIHQLQKEEIK